MKDVRHKKKKEKKKDNHNNNQGCEFLRCVFTMSELLRPSRMITPSQSLVNLHSSYEEEECNLPVVILFLPLSVMDRAYLELIPVYYTVYSC